MLGAEVANHPSELLRRALESAGSHPLREGLARHRDNLEELALVDWQTGHALAKHVIQAHRADLVSADAVQVHAELGDEEGDACL